MCVKSDAAGELVEAVKYLGWLPEPGIPHDDFHNSKLERGIRSIKEGSRSILLKAGFPHELWPRAVEYFCIAHSFSNLAALHPNESDEVKLEKSLLTCCEAANNGDPFTGWMEHWSITNPRNIESFLRSVQEHFRAFSSDGGLTPVSSIEMFIWS